MNVTNRNIGCCLACRLCTEMLAATRLWLKKRLCIVSCLTGDKKHRFYLTGLLVWRRYDGISEGSPGVVSDTVWKLRRCGDKGHVNVLSGRFGILCHNTSLQTGFNVSSTEILLLSLHHSVRETRNLLTVTLGLLLIYSDCTKGGSSQRQTHV